MPLAWQQCGHHLLQCHGIELVRVSSRPTGAVGVRGQVCLLCLLQLYHEKAVGMGHMDQNMTRYQVRVQGIKWYFSFMGYVLDAALNNAWQLHWICCSNAQVDLLAFRRYVACVYLESNADTSSQEAWPVAENREPLRNDRALDCAPGQEDPLCPLPLAGQHPLREVPEGHACQSASGSTTSGDAWAGRAWCLVESEIFSHWRTYVSFLLGKRDPNLSWRVVYFLSISMSVTCLLSSIIPTCNINGYLY